MHEIAIAESIVAMVDAAASGRRVHRVIVEVGSLSAVAPEALSFSFALVAEGSAAEGAELDIVEVEGDALNVKGLEVGGWEVRGTA